MSNDQPRDDTLENKTLVSLASHNDRFSTKILSNQVKNPIPNNNSCINQAGSNEPFTEIEIDSFDEDSEDGGGDDGGDSLNLPDPVEPENHVNVASDKTEDDAAYALRPEILWMRTEKEQLTLRLEETIVLNVLKR